VYEQGKTTIIHIEDRYMATKKTTTEVETISSVLTVQRGQLNVHIVGDSALICNRMSQKASRELLNPHGRKTPIEKKMSIKHLPVEEFRNSAYRLDAGAPTEIGFPAGGFKKSMTTAALDIPGAHKAQIGRLVWVRGELIPIYGVPELFMSIVRSSDIARTPDVRTRAILPRWACQLTIEFAMPLITAQAVINLLAAGGITSGIGDWRNEKGSASFGQFSIVAADDPGYLEILAAGGRAAQAAAFADPVCHDHETAELLSWYDEEMARRKQAGSPTVARRGEAGGVVEVVQ
jgi:hypothetical protein